VEVTAGGTFDPWPVQAWVEGNGLEVKPAKDKGKLLVTVAPEAAPGTYWIRLYNDEGATSPRPFLVGTLAETLEREPNDAPKKPQALDSSEVTVNGRLERTGDVDGFAVKLRKGQTLVASLEANRLLGSPMDAILQVTSADGFVLDQNHDHHGLDPQLVFVAPADATYVIRTFAFPATPDSGIRFAGGELYVYRLTLTTGGFIDHPYPLAVSRADPGTVELFGWNIPETAKKLGVASDPGTDTVTVSHPHWANTADVRLEPHATVVEIEPNDRPPSSPLALPVTVTGRIDPPRDVDSYPFDAKKGQKLSFRVEARLLGSPLDPVLRLTDAAGKTLAQADDTGPARTATRDPELAFTVPADGSYRLEVRDLHSDGGPRYVYRLRAVPTEPDYDLAVAADRFVLTPGKPLEIPITIDRRNGFDRAIEVSADGLPEGVTAEPVTSAPTGATVKAVRLRLTTEAGPVSAALRIVGRAKGEPELPRTASAALAGLNASTMHLWLTILKPGPAAEKK
jgi:hypothetical protein